MRNEVIDTQWLHQGNKLSIRDSSYLEVRNVTGLATFK